MIGPFFEVLVLLGASDGTFTNGEILLTVPSTIQIELADMDRDGATDIVALSVGGRLHVHRNLGGPWSTAGKGLAGAEGLPRLLGTGPLLEGELTGLILRDAAPLARAVLIVGTTTVDAPFKQDVLVPSPDIVLPPALTDTEGRVSFQAPWPKGVPPGLELAFHYWIKDAVAPAGLAASNGLLAVVP